MAAPKDRMRRENEEKMIARLIPNGPPLAMYDIGVGCYNEFRTLKQVWPDMQLFGCEPHPGEFEELKPIFDGYLINVAIGTYSRPMFFSKKGQGGSSFYHGENAGVEPITRTLDWFDNWAGQPDKILLWVDVEDAELDVFASGKELLASGRVEWINVETRDKPAFEGGPTTKLISDFLLQFGYVPIHRYNVQGAYPEAPGDVIYFKTDVQPLMPEKMNWGYQAP